MAGIVEKQKKGALRRLYDVCMGWVSGRYGEYILFAIAFVESSFFPLPPDVFLIAMSVAIPSRAFRYAAICATGSVLGGALGYGLGLWFMDMVGLPIIQWYGLTEKYSLLQDYFRLYDVWIVAIAGFRSRISSSPLPPALCSPVLLFLCWCR